MNEKQFKSLMVLNGDSFNVLAKALGMHPVTLRQKASGKAQFTQHELMVMKERYGLTNEQFVETFFSE